MSDYSKKFISASQIEEVKKQREAQGLPVEEEEYDPRSLYDRLQVEKMKKDEEMAESRAFKNQVHRLDEEEVNFLDKVSANQNALEKQSEAEAKNLVKEYKNSLARESALNTNNTNSADIDTSSAFINKIKSRPPTNSTSSQRALLSNAVKRKSTDSNPDKNVMNSPEEKKTKLESSEKNCSPDSMPGRNEIVGVWPVSREVTGCLPGIGEYSGESSSNCSSDSTDVEDSVMTLHYIAHKRDDDKDKD